MVGGQGLGQAPFAHHHEGNAIRQGPLLVGASTVQGEPSKEPVIGSGDDLQVGARQQGIQPPGEQLPIWAGGQCVADFEEDPNRGNEGPFAASAQAQRRLVPAILGVQQSQEVGCVGESHTFRLGVPCR